jgi:hypothetical protein
MEYGEAGGRHGLCSFNSNINQEGRKSKGGWRRL